MRWEHDHNHYARTRSPRLSTDRLQLSGDVGSDLETKESSAHSVKGIKVSATNSAPNTSLVSSTPGKPENVQVVRATMQTWPPACATAVPAALCPQQSPTSVAPQLQNSALLTQKRSSPIVCKIRQDKILFENQMASSRQISAQNLTARPIGLSNRNWHVSSIK